MRAISSAGSPGGCVEGAVVTEALDVIESGKPQDAGIRRRRRDRLEGRPLLRRHHPRLCREGGVDRDTPRRSSQRSMPDARARARRGRRHRSDERRAAAGQGGRGRAAIRSRTCIRSTAHAARAAWGDAEGKVFLTVHVPPSQLVIIGAVHISQALAPMARLLGYDVTIVDPRTAFAIVERFPDVKVIARMAGRGAAAARHRPLHRLRGADP